MTEYNIAETVERLTQHAAAVTEIAMADGKHLVVFPSSQSTIVHDEADNPLHHIRGRTVIRTLKSFADYVDRHAGDGTTVIVDLEHLRLATLIDGHHPDGTAGWCHHTAAFQPIDSAAWGDLKTILNTWVQRGDFAEILGRRLGNFIDPTSSDLLLMAENLNVTKVTEYSAGEKRDDGARTLSYVEEVSGAGGGMKQVTIPATISFEVNPFYDSKPYIFECDFRYKLRDEVLALRLEFPNLLDLERAMFEDYLSELMSEIGVHMPPVVYTSL